MTTTQASIGDYIWMKVGINHSNYPDVAIKPRSEMPTITNIISKPVTNGTIEENSYHHKDCFLSLDAASKPLHPPYLDSNNLTHS